MDDDLSQYLKWRLTQWCSGSEYYIRFWNLNLGAIEMVFLG